MTATLRIRSSVVIALALILPPSIVADEIILKDGKTIEWAAIRDRGDSYEVETPQGGKIIVKKEDVDRVTTVAKAAPLTGASFTFEKKRKPETVDLMSKINLKSDALSGSWKYVGGALVGSCSGDLHGKLQTSVVPPEEYDVTVVVERKEGADDFLIGLMGGGNRFTLHFDCMRKNWSGIVMVDGQNPDASGVGVQEKFFKNGAPRTITVMVRKDALLVRADGKDFFGWKADWSRISPDFRLAIPNKGALFIGVYDSTFHVTKFTLTVPRQ